MIVKQPHRAALLVVLAQFSLVGCEAVRTPSQLVTVATVRPSTSNVVEPTIFRRTGGLSGETVELVVYPGRPTYTLRRVAPGGAVLERNIPVLRPESAWDDDLPRLLARLDVPGGEWLTPRGAYEYQVHRGGHMARFNTAGDLPPGMLPVLEAFDRLLSESEQQAQVAGPAAPVDARAAVPAPEPGAVRPASATRPSTKPTNSRPGPARVITRVYDIDDLLPGFTGSSAAAGEMKSRAVLVEDLTTLFQDTVNDRPLKIEERDGLLTVSAPPAAHRTVMNLLVQLRETKLLTVWLEATLIQIPAAPRDTDARALRAKL